MMRMLPGYVHLMLDIGSPSTALLVEFSLLFLSDVSAPSIHGNYSNRH